ncbi:HAD family hydrolase, partial [Enterobacter hormaechei]|uniref:HAD family hydrolase n=1 Tax=Enterobacter hormaechei TaxID=158836 RepID=UPI0013CFA7A1
TERGLDFALARYGVADAGLRRALLEAYLNLDAYADVAPMLARLKGAGKATAIFTNGTRAMVGAAIAAAGLTDLIDHVVIVEPARAYKPA